MRRIWIAVGIIFFVISLTIVPALAQDGKGEPAPEKDSAKAPEKADKGDSKEAEAPAGKEDTAEEELVAVTGEKIEVLLREGDTLEGVVKGSRAEVMVNGRYRKAKNRDVDGAGIRVYYAMGLNGFVFVPYATIENIEFQGELSADEGIMIARRIAAERRQSEQDRVRIAEELEAKKRARKEAAEKEKAEAEGVAEDGAEEAGKKDDRTSGKDGGEKAGEAKLSDADRAKKIRDLLTKYPPEEWKPSRLAEIKDRKLILNIYPNEAERGFMENYDLWLKGYEIWQKQKSATDK